MDGNGLRIRTSIREVLGYFKRSGNLIFLSCNAQAEELFNKIEKSGRIRIVIKQKRPLIVRYPKSLTRLK